MGLWKRWLQHPEQLWLNRCCFYIHYWVGIVAGLYLLLMSLSGSILVYRDQISKAFSIDWLANLHANLLSGDSGRLVNGAGAICLTVLCATGAVIWWPGIKNWRRSLTFDWRLRFSRFTWDVHSALGFWIFLFVLMWGVSGIYFAFPDAFSAALAFFDVRDRFYDRALGVLSAAHFGRFTWYTEALWSALGLAFSLLAASGIFVCCHRMIYKKSSNPNRQ